MRTERCNGRGNLKPRFAPSTILPVRASNDWSRAGRRRMP
ncbi:hypothetical protein EDM68_01195 [Candidatus Uhrbacteria bacterium]|nr:MAG: hypothetical protein EDM68_01195 [Candidatus Uhrbacteria bacterium]